jgi:hypothetical protein
MFLLACLPTIDPQILKLTQKAEPDLEGPSIGSLQRL